MNKKYKSDIKVIHYFLKYPRYYIQQCVLYLRIIDPSCGPECGWAATSISIKKSDHTGPFSNYLCQFHYHPYTDIP